MDRERIAKLLAEARRHAREGAQRIARQKRMVATLKLAGKDSRMAVNLLETMQALQSTAEKRCIRLDRQLAAVESGRHVEKDRLTVVS
jgi:replication-associated recombination protein RarA